MTTLKTFGLLYIAAVAATTVALAHGPAIPPPPPPPPFAGPSGGGSQGYNGASGGGEQSDPSNRGGGSQGDGNGGLGGTPTGSGGGVSVAPGASGGVKGGGAVHVRRRAAESPWAAEVKISWNSAFLPLNGAAGYAKVAVSAGDALRRLASEGGMDLDGKPSFVFLYDPANESHLAALKAVEQDERVRIASYFFNCVRFDAAPAAKSAASTPTLAVYDSSGALLGEVAATKRAGAAYRLMETAFANDATNLSTRIAKIEPIVQHRAYSEWHRKRLECAVVCPDCGGLRDDYLKDLVGLKARIVAVAERLAAESKTKS